MLTFARRWLSRLASRRQLPIKRDTVRYRPVLEALEDRLAPALFLVSTLADDNPGGGGNAGDLRYAITKANAAQGSNTIQFLPGVTGTINLNAVLPEFIGDINVIGPGARTLCINGNQLGSVFTSLSDIQMSISGLTITGGSGDVGGAIDCNSGTLSVSDCNLIGNTARDLGGAINAAQLFATNCNISFNGGSANGGGIYCGSATLIGCTIANNNARLFGGGINALKSDISNCTFAGNNAIEGGGIYSRNAYLDNTVVTGNYASTYSGIFGAVDSGGYNFVTDSTSSHGWASTDQITTSDPLLGPLQDNGGQIDTMAPMSGSPLINAGDPSNSGLPEFDGRGPNFARVVGRRVDIGAVEYQSVVAGAPATVTVIDGNGQSAPVNSMLRPLTVLVSDANGNPVPGERVTFAAPSQPGASIQVFTNSSGIATASLQASQIAGDFTVTATCGDGSTSFLIHLTAGAPAHLVTLGASSATTLIVPCMARRCKCR